VASPVYSEYRELMLAGKFLEAVHLAEREYLRDRPDNPFWLTRQAAALSRTGDHRRSLAVGQQALAIKPSDPYAVLAVAEALHGLKQIQEALWHYQEIESHAKLGRHARKGILRCLEEQSDWDRILALLPQWDMPVEEVLKWRSKSLAALGRVDEAIAVCKDLLDRHPDLPEALWQLIDLEIRRDGIETVLHRMGKLAKIGSRPPIYKEIYASLCRRSGKHDLAAIQYDKLARTGGNLKYQKKMAFEMNKSGREEQALPILEELLKQDPKDMFVHSSYASACVRTGRLERLVAFYELLLEMHPHENSLHGRLKNARKKMAAEAASIGSKQI
jgi:tetratricopeptide (TPR) repeat protein